MWWTVFLLHLKGGQHAENETAGSVTTPSLLDWRSRPLRYRSARPRLSLYGCSPPAISDHSLSDPTPAWNSIVALGTGPIPVALRKPVVISGRKVPNAVLDLRGRAYRLVDVGEAEIVSDISGKES